jgi:hypothetical protein
LDTNFFKLYLEANKKLVKTICIKSETAAEMMQDYLLTSKGIGKPDDKSQWKYYKNICGIYHSTDTVMYVTSLDTLESIVFSKENLVTHSATKAAYGYGSRYYYSLLKDHPEQELLINGILLPADMEKTLTSPDWTIVSYDPALVEPQETTLISRMQSYIWNYQKRWHVQAFGLTDSLYNAAQFAILCLNLVSKLLNLRAEKCKTFEAHSFHIREYLTSHGRLDRYMPYMTFKQVMFLYRNINYLERNSGKVEQFKLLIEKILSDRGIPLAELSVRQLAAFDGNIYPEVRVRKKPLNLETNVPEKDYFSLDKLYEYERPTAVGNIPYLNDNTSTITHLLKTSSSSVIQSKDLQSSMLDYTDSVPDTMEEVLVRTWVQLTRMGYYDVYTSFKDPKSSQIYTMKTADAFIYYTYILHKRFKLDSEYVPDFINIKEVRNPRPSLTTMLKGVKKEIFTDKPQIAQALLDDMPHVIPVYSTSSFLELVNRLYNSVQRQWFVLGNTGDLFDRGQIAEMIHTLYRDKRYSLVPTQTLFTDWLSEKNLTTYDYLDSEADDLMKNIFMAATGYVIDETKQMANVQKAMISIMVQLSSYSVQYLREINDKEVVPVNWAAIRVGERLCTVGLEESAKVEVNVLNTDTEVIVDRNIETVIDKNFDVFDVSVNLDKVITLKNDALLEGTYDTDVSLLFPGHVMEADYPGYVPGLYSQKGYLGHEIYESLTPEEKSVLKFA